MAQNALESSRAKTISSTGKKFCMSVEIIPAVEKKFSKLKNFLIQLDRSCRTENEYVIIFFLRQAVKKWEPGKD